MNLEFETVASARLSFIHRWEASPPSGLHRQQAHVFGTRLHDNLGDGLMAQLRAAGIACSHGDIPTHQGSGNKEEMVRCGWFGTWRSAK